MAILKTQEIKEMSLNQISEKAEELRTELGKMKSQVRSGGAPENSGKMREIRRTIARLETFKAQKAKEGAEETKSKKK